jgi:hypothetical protein
MNWTMVYTFSGLAVVVGLLVGFGTLSKIRGLFAFLVCLGLAMMALLVELGVYEILAFFLGQAIVMGSTYICLRILRPEKLTEIREQFSRGKTPSCHL